MGGGWWSKLILVLSLSLKLNNTNLIKGAMHPFWSKNHFKHFYKVFEIFSIENFQFFIENNNNNNVNNKNKTILK